MFWNWNWPKLCKIHVVVPVLFSVVETEIVCVLMHADAGEIVNYFVGVN